MNSRILLLAAALSSLSVSGCFLNTLRERRAAAKQERLHEEDGTPPPAVVRDNRNATLTILDTLNKGREVSLADAAFGIAPSPGAAITEEEISPAAARSAPFRIQVMASSQIDNIRQERKQLETRTRLPLYVAFEAPYYKLLAGDFASRGEADAALPKIKKLGYPDAWVVRGKTPAQ